MRALPNANHQRLLSEQIPEHLHFADFSKIPDPLDAFFGTVYGDREGYVAISYGRIPNKVTFYEWPARKDQLLKDAKRRNTTDNVFYCPALRDSTNVSESGGLDGTVNRPVEPMTCLWLDIDRKDKQGRRIQINDELVEKLGGLEIASGRPGNRHIIIPVVDGMDLATFERLNKALKNAVGADDAQSHVKWLRLPRYPTGAQHVAVKGTDRGNGVSTSHRTSQRLVTLTGVRCE